KADAEGLSNCLEDADGPRVDNFAVSVNEEIESHTILHAVDTDVQNALGRYIARYPGLQLLPGTHRYYPDGDIACHVLGRLSRVNKDDIGARNDLEFGNELRQYQPNDLIGRTGLAALGEPTLPG